MSIATLSWTEPAPASFRAGAVTVGNFDGVHRGHLALLALLSEQAKRLGGPAVALTFDPHPLQILRPDQFQPALTTLAKRAALLQTHGADHVLILRTNADLLQQSASGFFNRILLQNLQARALVEGVNFGFGHNREGDINTLAGLCRSSGLDLTVVPPFEWNGAIVASSPVRAAILRGDVRETSDLLARPYRLCGIVGTGRQRGQTLGFPTANLKDVETVVPGDGVYAVRVFLNGETWPGAANVGPNPTFGEELRKLEVHLIGFQGDLVGKALEVEFLERLRETRAFSSPRDLVEQLRIDVETAREVAASAT